MRDVRGKSISSGVMLLLPLLLLCLAGTVQAQDVVVGGTVMGDAVPGGSVTVQADVTINDGSSITGYSWSQIGGPDANLSNTSNATVTVGLPGLAAFKANLIEAIDTPPIDESDFPPGVELPEGVFPAGIQDRFGVLPINPYDLEHGSAVELELTVTTTSGMYTGDIEVVTELPWQWQGTIFNVPVGLPLMLQGKEQDSYDWVLMGPGNATLMDATSRFPYFTPSTDGEFTVMVTDESDMSSVELTIFAGEWEGVISGQSDTEFFPAPYDYIGLPEADSCTGCHNGNIAPAVFDEWRQTGHAQIASVMLTENTHWGEGCFSCHTVGYNPAADNNGFDDQSDYVDWLNSGLINAANQDAWSIMLDDYEDSAQLANIQCENCHGPQDSDAHMEGEPRFNLSANVCATCHGEPPRHGRFQQWQLSAHSNYELAIDEGESGSCSRCHTVNGFLAWLPDLTEPGGDPTADVEVTWTADETHPQTCVTCHDPHNIGTVSGDDNDAIIRISGNTPELIAGFSASNVGTGAMCMTCHNTRRGLRNDQTWATTTDKDRAPHPGAQTDVLMGQNAYLVSVGQVSPHGNATNKVPDTCATCHMEATPPPADLSYNQSGTNHTFYARNTICSECHAFDASVVQGPVSASLEQLHSAVLSGWNGVFEDVFASGGTIALTDEIVIDSTADYSAMELGESRGRQALAFTLADSTETGFLSLGSITVIPPSSTPDTGTPLTEEAPDELLKAGWNFFLLEADGSHGVHNPSYVMEVLDNSLAALGGEVIPCSEDATTICLNDSRFKVTVDWRRPPGFPAFQPASVSNLRTEDSGIFYFQNSNNLEFLLKVLDGCSQNNNYWVFFAATTNVEFTVTVTDTLHGETKTYTNPLNHPADAVTDTSAFATCP